jgi:imidazolonepropionase-like amidohydrolase
VARRLARLAPRRHKRRDGIARIAFALLVRGLMTALAPAALALGSVAAAQSQPVLLIEGARVFDGTGAAAKVQDVLVEGERIVAVGKRLAVPQDATRVDGRGKTLIPGLHDLHTHLRSPAIDAPEDLGKAWAGYLLAGVTSVNDYSVSGEMIAPIRAMVASGQYWAPHLAQAVRFGVPGGHGTEYGWGHFFTLQATTARHARLQTPLALSYDPDVIKVFADGWRYGRDPDLAGMNAPTLGAIVVDAHAAGKPVVTHTVTLDGAKLAAAAGVDALGHGIGDALVDKELIALMRNRRTGYIGTTTVFEPQQTRVFAEGERAQFNPGERAREDAFAASSAGDPVLAYDARRWDILRANIRLLKKAGIPIGIGTDAGIGGVYHGASAIREITILTRLGFSASEALVAATRTSAAIMGQAQDHGTIEVGKRADLVLVDGAPDKDIADLWKVAQVWVAGREAPLAELRALRDSPAMTPMPVDAMLGPIMTGARSDGRTDLDTLPVATTDPGTDHSCLIPIDDSPSNDKNPGPGHGHAGHDHKTFLAAQMGGSPRPYVAWVLPLTRGTIHVADASRFTGIEIAGRGTGEYRLVLESYGLTGDAWFAAPLAPAETGKPQRIPFSAFTSRDAGVELDLRQLRAIRIMLRGEAGGTASLELGSVRFY